VLEGAQREAGMEAPGFQRGESALHTGGARGSHSFQPLSLGPRPTHKGTMSSEELSWLLSNTE